MELIIKVRETGTTCDENHGIPSGIFFISTNEWNKITKNINTLKLKNVRDYEEYDHSGGAHGCITTIHWYDAFASCSIKEEKVTQETINFVKKHCTLATEFLTELKRWISFNLNKLKVIEEIKVCRQNKMPTKLILSHLTTKFPKINRWTIEELISSHSSRSPSP